MYLIDVRSLAKYYICIDSGHFNMLLCINLIGLHETKKRTSVKRSFSDIKLPGFIRYRLSGLSSPVPEEE